MKEALDPRILSVVLFGSRARGDGDEYSDEDLCVFCQDGNFLELVALRQTMAVSRGLETEAVAVYPASLLEEMRFHGSLFLWHLKLEGKILFDRDGFAETVLGQLAEFTGYEDELSVYRSLLLDLKTNYALTGVLSEYDLHLLHSIVRDSCILLNYFSGKPVFGRSSAYRAATEQFGPLPVHGRRFEYLTRWHLSYSRGSASTGLLPADEDALELIDQVAELLEFSARSFSCEPQ